MTPTTRVISFPHIPPPDPYYDLFYAALGARGIEHVPGSEYDPAWFRSNCRPGDWVHLHWVGYSYDNPSRLLTAKQAASFVGFLVSLRRMGLRLAWTLHNLFPHESRSRTVDYAVRVALAQISELAIVHSRYARAQMRRLFLRARRIEAIHLGHFADYYPNSISRPAARAQLGLRDDAFVYLHLGQLRPYKGVEELIRAFRAGGDSNSVLVIAGRPLSSTYAEELVRLAGGDPRIRLDLRFLDDDELQTYFAAADLSVLPFRRVLTSASLLLSLSFGVPVLVAGHPSIREYVEPGVAYVLGGREPLDAGLRAAKLAALDGRLRRGESVIAWARGFRWDDGARAIAPLLMR